MDDHELQQLGLYDPSEPHAEEQLELLRFLISIGATKDDLLEFANELPAVASVIALRPGTERLTGKEVRERAGVPEELASKLQRAIGFPETPDDARIFSESDVEMLRNLQAGIALFGEEAIVSLARVIGSAMAKIADALISSFLVNIEVPIVDSDPVGLEVARANAAAVALLPMVVGAMDVLLRRHILAARRSIRALQETSGAGYEVQKLAVGFVDIVGSTSVAQRLTAPELGQMLATFETEASDVVLAGGGRVVKLIGDEVMFVAPDVGKACSIAIAMTERFADHPVVPPVRGAVAAGDVLSRDGDYYGPVVNLAARAVKAAEPDEIVIPADQRSAAETAGWLLRSLGATKLDGIEDTIELLAVKPA